MLNLLETTPKIRTGKILNMKEKSEVFTAVNLQEGGEVKQCISPLVPFPT
jgi:hypothetical protein